MILQLFLASHCTDFDSPSIISYVDIKKPIVTTDS